MSGDRLGPLPAQANATSSRFATHDVCAQCHFAGESEKLRDPSGRDVSPVGTWKASAMALAARDPYYLAAFADELAFRPGLNLTVARTCTRCHAPAGSVELEAEGIGPSFDVVTTEVSPLGHLTREGVACTSCHQIESDGLGTPASFTGGFTIGTGRRIYGPYENPRGDFMRTVANYTPTYAPHVQRSALCATCHTVITNPRDAKGNAGPDFPEQVPYLEWLASAYVNEDVKGEKAADCQDCHMPAVDEDGTPLELAIAKQTADLAERKPFWRHTFAGANVQLSRFGAADPAWFGAPLSREEHEGQGRANEAMLRTAAKLAVAPPVRAGEGIEIDVTVTNESGHKFPTGYPSRRAFLHVTVKGPGGEVLFESGRTDGFGRLVARTGEILEPATFFEHFDVVDDERKVQIYESVPVDVRGKIAHRPLDALRYAKDNRLVPFGFDRKNRYSAYTAPRGVDADPDWGSTDVVKYRVPKAPAGATVDVALLFQVVRPADFEALAAKPTPAARRLFDFVTAAPPLPIEIARASAVAP